MFWNIKEFLLLATPFPLCVHSGRDPLRKVGYGIRLENEVTLQYWREILGLAVSTFALVVPVGN